ncbi:hypothetical protein BE17_37245 [Sorangium cellulosum]|uniref:Uncharacterized protein n=1 Tax=Sorangium cellulosum TaxID=56 RepID=A0A150R8S7_SORCE|nr:hypothetical protein BE17_37245 [Sorangium cellulosum]
MPTRTIVFSGTTILNQSSSPSHSVRSSVRPTGALTAAPGSSLGSSASPAEPQAKASLRHTPSSHVSPPGHHPDGTSGEHATSSDTQSSPRQVVPRGQVAAASQPAKQPDPPSPLAPSTEWHT